MILALTGFLCMLSIQYILGNQWFSIGKSSIVSICRWVVIQSQFSSNNGGIKSFTNKSDITSGFILEQLQNPYVRHFLHLGMIGNLFLFVYNLFAKWLVLKSILTLTLLVCSKKKIYQHRFYNTMQLQLTNAII